MELPIWPIWPNFEVNGLDWQCCLAGSSKTAPRIFIFSIVLGAENLSYVKSIETHARAFLPLNILSIGTVCWLLPKVSTVSFWFQKKESNAYFSRTRPKEVDGCSKHFLSCIIHLFS